MNINISDIDKNRRCPWCGELVSPPAERYSTVTKCPHCKNKYSFYWSKTAKIAEAIFIILLCITIYIISKFEQTLHPIIFFTLFFGILLIFNIFDPSNYYSKPYKKVEEIKNYYENKASYKVHIEINEDKLPRKKISQVLKYNTILPICFKDDMNYSEYICVSLSDVEIDGLTCECKITELPLGKHIDENIHSKEFCVYFNEEVVGQGYILEKI